MRYLKHLITAAAAAVCMISYCVTCYADDENGENYVVTTTTGTSAEGQNGVIWTQITEEKPVNGLDNDAVQIDVSVSNIEDGRFTAALDIKTRDKISYFAGSIGYDPDEFRLLSARLTDGDGGVLSDEMQQGKYSFKYSNEQGSGRSGEYIILSFEMIGQSERDDVLFLTVESLLDSGTNSLSFNKTDGIVAPTSSPNISQDVKSIRLSAFARPYTFEELGFEDVINCEMDESQVAKYSEGGIVAMTPGFVDAKLINMDYTIQKVRIEVYRADTGGTEQAAAPLDSVKPAKGKTKSGLSVNVGVPILLIVALMSASALVRLNRKKYRRIAARAPYPRGSYDPRYQSYPPNRRPRR